MRGQVRVAVVDDHPLFVRGLELLLPVVSDGRVVVTGTANDASAAAALARRLLPDLLVVDLGMPEPGGVRAIAAVRRTEPACRLLAMSGLEDPAMALAALRAGAEGFLPKSAEPEDLVPPLLAAAEGWSVVPPALLATLVAGVPAPATGSAGLTEEDRRLWRLIAEGTPTADLARTLHVSERTAKRLVASLLRKLRVSNRTEAAALAGSSGLLGSED